MISISGVVMDHIRPSFCKGKGITGPHAVHAAEKKMKTMMTILGCYYVATGLWPLISIINFQMFTGVKKDTWLVKQVGLLAAAIGFTFLYSARVTELLPPEMNALAILTTISFISIDVHYVRKGTIPKIYLADAVVEAGFLIYFTGRILG